MIDPDESPQVQIARQARIIDALIRRATREADLRPSRFAPFRSAIELQGEVWAKTRDLERAESELEALRLDRERARLTLAEAVSAMKGGFALFTDRRLALCNELFRTLIPDLTERIRQGLGLTSYFAALRRSPHIVSTGDGGGLSGVGGAESLSIVIELEDERFFQWSLQRTSARNAVLLLTDISAIARQNRSERAALIDRQAHYLQAAVDHLGAGLCTFTHDGQVVLHNARFADLLGLPPARLVPGTPLARVVALIRARRVLLNDHVIDPELWEPAIDRTGEHRARLRHVSGRILDLHAHPLPDGGFIVDLMDVTLEVRATETLEARVAQRTAELTEANERLRAQSEAQARVEEELRHAKDAAEAAYSSKTRFLAAASHDLLQPISAARLLISSIGARAAGTGLAPSVEHLAQSFESVEQLLQSLLDISRLDSVERALEPAEVALAPLLTAVRRDLAPLAERRGVRLGVVPSEAVVRSDARYLRRSIQNLVANAIQYTEAGGRVLLGCRHRAHAVEIQVHDTGLGISEAELGRIFLEFDRAGQTGRPGGVGLGLSIVERTCRHLNHDLRVTSAPGAGSMFSITAERVAGARPDAPRLIPETGADEASGLIVLLLENDPALLFATTELLERWGAGVLGARSVAEAQARLAEIGTAPDLVLADFHLDGEGTGLDAIAAIRAAAGTALPAILLTGDRSRELAALAAEAGVPLLAKPVDTARLRALVARVPGDEGLP